MVRGSEVAKRVVPYDLKIETPIVDLLLFPRDKCMHKIKHSLPSKDIMYRVEASFLQSALH